MTNFPQLSMTERVPQMWIFSAKTESPRQTDQVSHDPNLVDELSFLRKVLFLPKLGWFEGKCSVMGHSIVWL